jgi:myo-inositol-1(or 4)-monophosphatase
VSDYSGLLPDLASIAEEAGEIASNARGRLEAQIKPDGSILTNADQESERFLREKLAKLVPGAAVWGEEYGFSEQVPEGLWLVDPIDGTSNFRFGSPLWGVSIALLVNDTLEMGVVALPDLCETYLAGRGQGVTLNGKSLAAIPAGRIQPYELVSYNDHVSCFGSLPGKMRHAGAAVIDGCFVACQRYRGLIGIRERLYDIAACVLMALELGADVRYADGSPFDLGELKHNVKVGKPWIMFPPDSGFYLNKPENGSESSGL